MLTLENVTKKYMTRTALDNVSLTLEAGKTCLLLGPNGSGKTTMMKLVAGLARPTSGRIAFQGMPIGPGSKARIAYMPTENYFYNYMTIRDAGRYYADFFDDFSLNRFRRALIDMGLDPRDRIRQLSSGMAAKLRLALVMARDAEMMMFDEPLNGVDILTRTQVIDAILAGRKEGRTMLISTHLVDELEDVVDEAVLLKEGVLAGLGAKAELCGGGTLKDLYLRVYGQHSAEPFTAGEEAAHNA